jgi:hypothetical protein
MKYKEYTDPKEAIQEAGRLGSTHSACASRACPTCKQSAYFALPISAIKAYEAGALIQQAFPFLSADQRERFMTGYCQKCWNELFA